ncbi:MAG: protein phosphatase 2C domain-containing protein [Dermatophilaceae bacterium]
MTLALRYAARSHLGLGPKTRNEDSGYAGPHLLVLADGMGGHAAGDVASSMIVGSLAHLDDEGLSAEQAMTALADELAAANDRLAEAMHDDADLAGMGSTTIAILRSGTKLAMAHIGDSRAYLLREGDFSQLTKDHSFVQHLLDERRISEDEALHHPQRSLVTRVMTGQADDQPDLSVRELLLGDRYLLCSDGLTDFVTDDTVREILAEASDPDQAAERLVEVAVKASARDNITVVVADAVDADAQPPPSSIPQVVGAAAVRRRGRRRTRAIPISPAEKAAALSREVSGLPDDEPAALAEEAVTPRVLWLRRAGIAAAAAVVLVGATYAGYAWTQRQYFIGADDGYVAIYRGVNQDLGPVHLGEVAQRSTVLVTDLPGHYQDQVRGTIPVSTRDDADARVASLRIVAAECRALNTLGTPCGSSGPTCPPSTTSAPNATNDPAVPAAPVELPTTTAAVPSADAGGIPGPSGGPS